MVFSYTGDSETGIQLVGSNYLILCTVNEPHGIHLIWNHKLLAQDQLLEPESSWIAMPDTYKPKPHWTISMN